MTTAAAEPTAPASTWTNPADGSEMIVIPAGPFLVGRDRLPAAAPAFSLARHPVTNAQFARFLEATGHRPDPAHPENGKFLSHWTRGRPPKALEQHPVTWVSLVDALAYLRWAGLTLPTEWFWEKAARGDDGRRFPWGDELPYDRRRHRRTDPSTLVRVSADGTRAVGSYPRTRTPYGCEDLVGNVSEWCLTTPEGDYGRPPPDAAPQLPIGEAAAGRSVVRGACFLRTTERSLEAAGRRFLSMTRRNAWTGFRAASNATAAPGA